mmetsp:Transcript_5458/g.11714  ORF Transcript_5458/g.11714 Transcript_5458/m.11714 type:complete len:98 (+) Transcript_5458:63-356(+)
MKSCRNAEERSFPAASRSNQPQGVKSLNNGNRENWSYRATRLYSSRQTQSVCWTSLQLLIKKICYDFSILFAIKASCKFRNLGYQCCALGSGDVDLG